MQPAITDYQDAVEPMVSFPAEYTVRLLSDIDDLAELKLTLYCLWAMQQKDGPYRYLRYAEMLADANLMRGISQGGGSAAGHAALDQAIACAVARGTLLEAQVERDGESQRVFVLNDARGRRLHDQLVTGNWRPAASGEIEVLPVRPSLYGLYEANIGVLTPMIAEAIKDAAATYPRDWIEDAMRYAVERNARNWRYIRKVLENWQLEGRTSEQTGRQLERHKRYRTRKR